jgi:hypothetical protein
MDLLLRGYGVRAFSRVECLFFLVASLYPWKHGIVVQCNSVSVAQFAIQNRP